MSILISSTKYRKKETREISEGFSKSLILSFALLAFTFFSLNAQNCSVNAGVDFSICANSVLTLGGGKAGVFQGAGNVTWSQVSGPSAVITNPSSLSTTVTSLVGGNIYKFRLSATCSDGSLVFDEVSVTVLSISTSNAGPDQTVCPGNGVTSLAAAPLITGETGIWTTQGTNNGITIVTPGSPTSSINVNSSNVGNTTLRWTITNGGCTSFDDVVITNRGGVSVVTAGADRALNSCYATTQSTNLAASLGGGGVGQTGIWTVVDGPNVPTITSPNSNNSAISNLIQGIYTFRWTVSGTCVNGTAVTHLTVPAPNGGITTATVSPATTGYCDGRTAVVLVGSVPGKPNETVAWTKTGSAGGTIDSPTSTTINISGLVPGASYTNSNSYTYTISSTNGCPASTASRTVNWTAPPSLSISTSSPMQLGCGVTSATINYTSFGGTGSVQWMILSGPVTPTYPAIPTGWTNGGVNSVTLSGFTKPGTYQIRFQKNAGNGSGCTAVFQDFTLVVAPTPTASNAGTDQVLACNVFNTNLVGNVPTSGTGMWTQVIGPNTANLPSPYLNNSPISGLISGKYTFRWLIYSGNTCANTQNDVSVIVSDPSPTASAAGSDLTICNSTPVILTGNPVKLNETGTWTVTPSAGTSFSDNHSQNAEALGLTPNTTYTFTWTITNACGTSADNVIITTNGTAGPIPALAGPDQCLPAGTTSVTMAGNIPDPGTGNWAQVSGNPVTITSPSQYNTPITGLSNGTFSFEWSITRNTCTVTRDTVVITISGAATTANAGPDQNVCGTSTTLAGNVPVTGLGHWTQIGGPGGVIITDPSLTNSSISGLIAGAYTFRWTIRNGTCTSNLDDVQINVSIPPTVAIAGPDQSICSGTTVTMAGNPITAGTGLWTIVSGPNSPSITTPGSPTTTITGLTNGTYIIRWKSYNGTSCPASTDDLIVDVTQAVTNASLGGNQTLCGSNSVTLTGNISTTGTWTQDTGLPNIATITPISPSAALATGLIPGIYTFRYTYAFPTTCTNTATITVTISAMPIPADAGPDLNVCDATSLNMAGNIASAGAGIWSKISGPNTPNIVNSSSPTTAIGTTTNLINGTYVYRWTITNGSCSTSDDIMINRSSSATVSNAGSDQPSVCGTVATMAANTPAPGVGTWSQISGPNTPTISSAILPNTTITGMITGTYVFRWSITNGFCSPSTDDVSITMFETPTAANAGPDQSLCGNTSTALSGNAILTGTGQWSQVSGPNSAVIESNTDPLSIVSGLIAGTYVFKWTSINGSCSSSDNVSVFITNAPTISDAGPDQSICLFSTLNLTGNTPVIGTGLWTQISGNPAIIQSPSTPVTSITGVSAGTYGFRWTIINGTCPPSTDDITITVNDLPSLALAGPDQSLCNLTSATLAATVPTVGIGTWAKISGPNTPVITNPNIANTTVTGMIPGTYVFSWSVANGPCASSDQVQIIISSPPTTANAGADQSICGTTTTTLEGNPALVGTGTWIKVSGPNTPSFTNLNSESTTVTGLITGTYVFKWTISNGSCTVSSDNVQIAVTTGSVTASAAGPDQTGATLCGLTTSTLAANVPVTGTGLWTIHSGIGGTITNPSDHASSFSGISGSTYVLRWTITNGTCSSFDDATVFFPKNPTPSDAGADRNGFDMCGVTSALLSANSPTIGSGLWSIVSGTGGSFDNASSPTANFSGIAGTLYSLKWTISNSPCNISEDQVTVEFKLPPVAPAGSTPQSFCKGDSPVINNIDIIGANIKWYDAPSGGNLLPGITNLVNGVTYYASQTVSGCESHSRVASTISVVSCIGPVLNDVTVSLDENSANGTIVYDANDANTGSDKDGDIDNISYSIFSGNDLGAFGINSATGIITVADVSGINFEVNPVYVLMIKATDGLNESLGTITININNLNDNPPVGIMDVYSVAEGGTLTVNSASGVLRNDSDADGNTLTAVLVSDVSHGMLTLNSDGAFSYTHNGSETISDNFTYKVNDGSFDGNTVQVSITIIPVNDPPVAIPDVYSVNEGGSLNISPGFGVLNNDTDTEGNTLGSILVTDVTNGILTLNSDGSFIYLHDGSETTTDSFTYKVNDGIVDGNTVTVSITIFPVNDAPVALPDSYTVTEGGTLSVNSLPGVLNNDSDAEGSTLISVLVSDVINGILTFNSDGSFTYLHDGSETSSDSFSYKVNDGVVDGNTVTVTITVVPVNDVPVAIPDSYSLSEGGTLNVNTASGVLSNDSDAEGNTLTSVLVSDVINGTLTLNSDGSFTYIHNGSETTTDSFTYKLNDGITDGNTVSVSITIIPVNDPPVISDFSISGKKNNTIQFSAGDFNNFFTDAEGNALAKIMITSPPANGKLKLSGSEVMVNDEVAFSDLGNLTLEPDINWTGNLSIGWNAFDGNSFALLGANVNISINTFNNAPTLSGFTKTVNENSSLTFSNADFTNAFSDIDGNALIKIKITNLPANGTLELSGVNLNINDEIPVSDLVNMVFIPDASWFGSTNAGWNGFDGTDYASSSSLINIIVTSVNQPPVVSDFTKNVDEDHTLYFSQVDFTAAYNDQDGNTLSKIKITRLPGKGMLKLSGINVIVNDEIPVSGLDNLTYVPDSDWNGALIFAWNGFDGTDYASAEASANITVNAVNDPPVISSPLLSFTMNENGGAHQINIAGNITDVDGDLLTTSVLVNPSHGSVIISNTDIVYTPDQDYSGNDTFEYQVCDNSMPSLCANGKISMSVIQIAAANHAPIIKDIFKTTIQNTSFKFGSDEFLSEFSDPDNDNLVKIQISSLPLSGTLKINNVAIAEGQEITGAQLNMLEYVPLTDYTGEVSFSWQGSDGKDYSTSADVNITITPQDLFIPEGFSPNGDGVNDFFIIRGIDNNEASVSIYNRWGNMVYLSKKYKNDWDGSANSGLLIGSKLPEGTYFYVINLNNGEKPKVGYITINR